MYMMYDDHNEQYFKIEGFDTLTTPDAAALAKLISEQDTYVQFICSLGKFIWDAEKQYFVLIVNKRHANRNRTNMASIAYTGKHELIKCKLNRKHLLPVMFESLQNGTFTIKIKIVTEQELKNDTLPSCRVVHKEKYTYTLPYTNDALYNAIGIMNGTMGSSASSANASSMEPGDDK